MGLIRFLTLIAVLFAAVGNLTAKTIWKSGRVISTGLNGYGYRKSSNAGSTRREVVWWTYCISTEAQTYSVLSRISPTRTGLKENSDVRFIEVQNQIYVVNPAGKKIALRIIRKGKTNKCP